jgi:hypothetical protein
MKTALMAVGLFALLPFALPAILVFVLIVAAVAHWLAPLIWLVAVVYFIAKLIQGYRREHGSGVVHLGSAGGR